MNNKYKLLEDETKTICWTTVYRIQALRDFGDVNAGDKGGYIEKEENLSIIGNAWVYDNAVVCNDAVVCGDAVVRDGAVVCGDAVVGDGAVVCGDAVVGDGAVVCGDAVVGGGAVVCGDAVVRDDAVVVDNAEVRGDAVVCGDARIERIQDYFCAGPIGSRDGYTTFYRTSDGIGVSCGCFTGDIDKFLSAVNKMHGDSMHGKRYRALIDFAKVFFEIEKPAQDAD